MGREKSRNAKVHIHIAILTALDSRLEEWAKAHGWSKTKVIEYAIAGWLNDRDMEKKNGLAKAKQ